MKSLTLFVLCMGLGLIDVFYLFLILCFCFFYLLFDLSVFYFGGLFFCDSFSFFLIFLSVLVFLFCILTSLSDYWSSNFFCSFNFFLASIFFLLFLCFFVFNIFMFYIFFEVIFFLMFFFLLVWGYSPERLQASLYMVFYTIVVSFPFLIFVIFMEVSFLQHSFNSFSNLSGLWWGFVIFVFLVKLPVYGVHLWLPKAHVEAPVTGSMVLAGVLLKLGGYGIYRFSYYLLPLYCSMTNYFFSLGLMGGLYSCLLCLRQCDLKSFVAYSSICHMGYTLSGFYSLSALGLSGGVFMLVAHGLCSSCLFYMLYLFYERLHTRSVFLLKGFLYLFPSFSLWIFISSIFNMGVPPSFSFFSEICITTGLLSMDFSSFLFVFGVVFFGGVYGVFLYVVMSHGIGPNEIFSVILSFREYLNTLTHVWFLLFIPLYLNFFYF